MLLPKQPTSVSTHLQPESIQDIRIASGWQRKGPQASYYCDQAAASQMKFAYQILILICILNKLQADLHTIFWPEVLVRSAGVHGLPLKKLQSNQEKIQSFEQYDIRHIEQTLDTSHAYPANSGLQASKPRTEKAIIRLFFFLYPKP